jgi:PAS domain S-box-containing protein
MTDQDKTRAELEMELTELREKLSKYQLIIDNMVDTIWLMDMDMKFIYVSPSVEKVRGFTLEQLAQYSLDKVLTPDSFTKVMEVFARVMPEIMSDPGYSPVQTLDLEFYSYDGSTHSIESKINIIRDQNGIPVGILGQDRDITERRITERALKESELAILRSEEKNRTILLTAMDGFWMVNLQGNLVAVNESYCRMSGYSEQELLTMSIPDLETTESANHTSDHIKRIIDQGQDRFESQHRRRDGSVFDIEVSVQYNPLDGGCLVAFLRDITEHKHAELDLYKAKEKAEESDRLKSAFLANMSHEIRTPMNGILGFAALLKEPNLSGKEQQEYIRIIEKSGKRMLNIIHNIVDISKIESGQVEVSMSEMNINEQTEYIYNFFIPEVEKKGLQFILKNTLPSKEAIIETDREKTYTILTNLVKNACTNTLEGSIEIGYEKKGGFLEFYVKDTGIGIPLNRQEVIFERFIQADISNKHAQDGAGLGLAIAKAYVDMLGGEIRVESREGAGSDFYYTIPYKCKTAEKVVSPQTDDAETGDNQFGKLKILIVEDDETSELFLSMAVKNFSREVLTSGTGMEAVDICRNNPDLDLILMDIRLPDMNGYEITRRVRQFNSEIIIIAQTAYGLSGDREKALTAGCNDYISKPVDGVQLQALLYKYFKPGNRKR